jgi:hypothetical protein
MTATDRPRDADDATPTPVIDRPPHTDCRSAYPLDRDRWCETCRHMDAMEMPRRLTMQEAMAAAREAWAFWGEREAAKP